MMQKTVQHTARDRDEEEPDVQPVPDERARQVSEDAADVLAQIDCCLAEVENAVEQAERDRAKAEWQELRDLENRCCGESTQAGWDEYTRQVRVWMARYQHLFEFCCGEPVFD